jgi:hypothetical protein
MPDDVPPEMAAAVNAASTSLLRLEGVNGIDIGLDEAGNFTIRVLVSDPDNPPLDLPESVGGFPFILVKGQPTLEQASIPDERTLGVPGQPPIIGGIQIAPDLVGDVTAGTLGCVFRNSDGQPVAVGNAHVMCGSDTNIIKQAAGRMRLGTVQKCFAPDTPSFPPGPVSGFFDAAICSIDDGRPSTVGEIAEIGTATAISSPRIGDIVRKRGFKTGLSHGVVEGILGAYKVRDDQGNLKWFMLGQVSIVIIPDLGQNPLGVWSRGGDSGSVVVNNSNEIVALHWGGDRMPGDPADGHRGYATDFATVAIALEISL